MFSDKNYGLPKDLIEAAKRVHEKHLMEYDEDGHIDNPPEGTKGTKKDREKAAKMGLKGPHLEGEGRVTKKQKQNIPPLPVRKPKNEEVQFTEEELAEAFAIFLEENFHVEMLTEEDLDYVFENEFPNFVRRAQKVSKEMVEKVRAKMNTFTGKEYSFNAIDMQLKYAFSEYLSSSENMLDGYREHDLRLIEIYN